MKTATLTINRFALDLGENGRHARCLNQNASDNLLAQGERTVEFNPAQLSDINQLKARLEALVLVPCATEALDLADDKLPENTDATMPVKLGDSLLGLSHNAQLVGQVDCDILTQQQGSGNCNWAASTEIEFLNTPLPRINQMLPAEAIDISAEFEQALEALGSPLTLKSSASGFGNNPFAALLTGNVGALAASAIRSFA